MIYKISIIVDENDGDYNEKSCTITADDIEEIKPLIEAIKLFKPYIGNESRNKYGIKHSHNYPCGECLREDMGELKPAEIYPEIDAEVFELFEEFIPHPQHGFHTITSIIVIPTNRETVLF